MLYSVLLCRKCGQPGACRNGSKTFTCAYCGSRNLASGCVRILEHVESRDVPSVLARLKSARADSCRKSKEINRTVSKFSS